MKSRTKAIVIVVVVLAIVVAGAVYASVSGNHPLQSKKNVYFAYDWPTPDMELIPVVVAEKEGFFSQNGIKVYISFPPNTSTTTQMLTAGSADIGFITTTDMVTGVSRNLPLLSIANYSMTNNWGLFTAPGKVLTLANLKGSKVFSYGDTWTQSMLPFVYKKAGITANQVTVVTSTNDIPLLLSGKVTFSTSTTNYEIPGIAGATNGKAPGSTLTGSTIGVPDIPIWDYATTTGWAKNHSGQVKSFLAAIKQATQWAIDNPAKAVSDFEAMYPNSGYDNAYNTQGWNLTIPLLKNANGDFFVENDSQWTTLCSAMKDVNIVTTCPAASTYYTNQYQP